MSIQKRLAIYAALASAVCLYVVLVLTAKNGGHGFLHGITLFMGGMTVGIAWGTGSLDRRRP